MSGPRVRAVAVVGAGFQGAQIAYRCAQYGLQVAAFDVSRAAMERAEQSARGWAEAHVAAGRLTELEAEDLLARITLAPTLDACVAAVDLVIEAVPEVLTLKQDVWEQIDVAAPPGVLLGTNSSSLKGSDIAVRTARKELTFNVNFGMPAESDLIEVMWNDWTSEPTKSAVRTWLGALGMVYIESKKEIKGYAFNRVWRAVKKECLFLADQGFCDPEDLDRAFIIALEAPTGPFQLMDKIGLDVVRDIELSYYQESGDERDRPPALLEEMVARGDLGRKTGRGFYQYPHPSFEREGWLLKKAHPPEGVSGGAISATQGGQA